MFIDNSEASAKLLIIFQNVNDWLKFAEAKNAALLAFSGTGFTAILGVLTTAQGLPSSLRIGLFVSTGFLSMCILLCALSFTPKTNLERLLWLRTKPGRRSTINGDDNFYFFENLRKYDPAGLLVALDKYYFSDSLIQPYAKELRDLASQITINSDIADLKYEMFNRALYFLISAILAVPLLVLVNLLMFRGL